MSNYKKKILAIGPILPQWSDIKNISDSMNFLNALYSIDFIDPLDDDINLMTTRKYTSLWKEKIEYLIRDYDILFGFSLGGTLLQSAFESNLINRKKLILFSTPAYANETLNNKLSEIVGLINENLINTAMLKLNKYVFYPHESVQPSNIHYDDSVGQRLKFGFSYILNIDNRKILNQSSVHYMHFIGSESQLVTETDLVQSDHCKLIRVPDSGMRVLQNNNAYCMKHILNYLEGQ